MALGSARQRYPRRIQCARNDVEADRPILGTAGRTLFIASGLQLIARNFSTSSGEIDLIMRDEEHVAFIEVRYRGSDRFGGAIHSITLAKQRKLKRCAALFSSAGKSMVTSPLPL